MRTKRLCATLDARRKSVLALVLKSVLVVVVFW